MQCTAFDCELASVIKESLQLLSWFLTHMLTAVYSLGLWRVGGSFNYPQLLSNSYKTGVKNPSFCLYISFEIATQAFLIMLMQNSSRLCPEGGAKDHAKPVQMFLSILGYVRAIH